MKNIAVNTALTLLSIFVVLSFIELGLRQTAYRSVLTHYKYPKGYYQNTPGYGFDITPAFPNSYHVLTDLTYRIWSNRLGCFDDEYKNEESYIYLAGDSFTWGYAPFRKKFGVLVEEELSTRVLKCGVSGFGTKQQYLKSKAILGRLKHKPELIIVGYFIGNDFEDDYTFPNYAVYDGYRVQVRYLNYSTGEIKVRENLKERYKYFSEYCSPKKPKNPGMDRVVCFIRRHSIVFNLLKGQLRSFQKKFAVKERVEAPDEKLQPGEASDGWRERAFPEHLKNLKSFKSLAGEYGSRLLFVLIPSKDQVYQFLNKAPGAVEKQLLALKEYLEVERIEYLDLTPFFRKYADNSSRHSLDSGRDLYLPNDHHWTSRGDLLAGLEISKYILEKKLLQVEGSEGRAALLPGKIKDAFEKGP